MEWPFTGKSRKSSKGWIRKNLRFHPSYQFCEFSSKMTISTWKWKFRIFSESSLWFICQRIFLWFFLIDDNFDLKMEILNFLGIQPMVYLSKNMRHIICYWYSAEILLNLNIKDSIWLTCLKALIGYVGPLYEVLQG